MNDALKGLKDKMSTQGIANLEQERQEQEVSDTMYQQYSSARISTCLITPTGKRINFTNYEYYTKDPEIVRYLDKEIANGLREVRRGALVSVDEINPKAALKRKHIEEFLASQEGRDFSSGQASAAQTAKKVGILSTNDIAGLTG